MNPADIVPRGFLLNDLVKNEVSFKGPTFLTLPESGWLHFTIVDKFNSDIIKEEEKRKIHSVYNKYSNSCIQSISLHPILNNLNKINSNSPGSDGYIKEELLMLFLHGKLKIVDAEQLSFVLKLFHVTLYVFKGAL